ncbi:MAG: YlmC/YmxH family sporulation protein [Clostridia bacterium]|nr:YlmC/YmxH family sporulation protein [Clostridia bacterium]
MISFNELKKKEILDISTGTNLGKPTDLIFNRKSGRITKLIASGKKGGFLSCDTVEIQYSDIVKIGDDAILVEFNKHLSDEKKCLPCKDACFDEKEDGFCDD